MIHARDFNDSTSTLYNIYNTLHLDIYTYYYEVVVYQ